MAAFHSERLQCTMHLGVLCKLPALEIWAAEHKATSQQSNGQAAGSGGVLWRPLWKPWPLTSMRLPRT